MQKLKQLIKNNNSNELESYINNNNILEEDVKNSQFDILFFAIEKRASPETVKRIISCFPEIYGNLNYLFRKHSPLSTALKSNNIQVAELLVDCNARINFYGHRFDNALFCLYRRNLLKESSLRFLIGNKAETYGNKFFEQLIANDNPKFLEIFLTLFTPYKNKFIIDLLLFSRNNIPISKQNLSTIIEYEKSKIYKTELTDKLIHQLCFNSSVDTLRVIFNNKILRQKFQSSVNYYELLNNLSFNNSVDKIKFVLEQGVNVNFINSEILINVIKNNNIELAKYVIDKGIYINCLAANNVHLVWTAYELSHNDMVKLLIKNGADLFINDTDYETILEIILNDKLNIVNISPFLSQHYSHYISNIINIGHDSCKSTLIHAIEHQNIKIVKHLLQTNTFHYCKSINSEKDFEYAYQNYKSELILACEIGSIESVDLILKKGENINCIYYKTKLNKVYTPLGIAAESNNLALVQYLLTHGSHPNPEVNPQYRKYYKSALRLATEQGNEAIVKYLIEKGGAMVDERDANGKNIFTSACENVKTTGTIIIEFLLDKGANINCIFKGNDNECYTPLSMASKANNLDLVKFLLDYGAQTNPEINPKYKKYYKSALMHAFKQGNEEVAKCLLTKGGADINEKDSDGKTIFMYACENCSNDIIQFIINKNCRISDKDEDNKGNTALHYICQTNNLENKENILKKLIETYKFDINKQNHKGESALHIVTNKSNASAIRYLIKSGADINIPDMKKFTPFVYACLNGNKKIVSIFAIKKECNVNAKGFNGKNALIYAFEKGLMDIASYLIEKVDKIEIDLFCPNGNSILMYACQYGNSNLVKYIVEKYPRMVKAKGGLSIDAKLRQHENIINAKGINNKTALMYACENGHYEIVKYLIEMGADMDIIASNGNTPLIYAVMSHSIEVVRFLVVNYPKVVEHQNREGKTALTIAEENGHLNIAKFIKSYTNKKKL